MSSVLAIPNFVPSKEAATAKALAIKASADKNGGTPVTNKKSPPERSLEKKARDEVCKRVRAGNRFDSFAPERSGNAAKW